MSALSTPHSKGGQITTLLVNVALQLPSARSIAVEWLESTCLYRAVLAWRTMPLAAELKR